MKTIFYVLLCGVCACCLTNFELNSNLSVTTTQNPRFSSERNRSERFLKTPALRDQYYIARLNAPKLSFGFGANTWVIGNDKTGWQVLEAAQSSTKYATLQLLLQADAFAKYHQLALFGLETSKYHKWMRSDLSPSQPICAIFGLEEGWIKSNPIRHKGGEVTNQWTLSPIQNIDYKHFVQNNQDKLVAFMKY